MLLPNQTLSRGLSLTALAGLFFVAAIILPSAIEVTARAQSPEPAQLSRQATEKTSDAGGTLQFPDESVGEISSRPASSGDFGYSLDSTAWKEWVSLGQAQGVVAIPEGHVASLQLNRHGASDTSWVDALEPTALVRLIASQTELGDKEFAKLNRLSGLRHLDVGFNKLTKDIAEALAGFGNLQYLWISYMPEIDDELMPAVAALPQLEEVGIWSTSVSDKGLAALAESRSLRAIYAGRTPITDKGVKALMKLPTLRAVDLSSEPERFRQENEKYPELTDDIVDALCSRPELESLSLKAAQISDEGLARLADSLKHLRSLVLDHTPISRKGLKHLNGFESLESLRCYQLNGDGSRFDDSVAIGLSGTKSLKSIQADVELTDKGVMALAKLPLLEELKLSGRGVTDASMPSVAAMPSLIELRLGHTRVTDEGFDAFNGSDAIVRVQLTGNRMTTRCVETLATMPNLKQVGLMTIDARVDGKPTWQGIEGLTGLKEELWLHCCPKLSTDNIAAIASFKDLKHLRIEGGGALTDADVMQLKSSKQLEQLTLTSTVASDRAMVVLAKLPKLRSLDLGCVATDAGLRELVKSESLQWLTFASPNVTDEAFAMVSESATRFESIRRGKFLIGNSVVSKSKSETESDPIWRLGTLDKRKELNELEGEPAPKITASHWVNGSDELSLSDLHGKVVLIDFWGSWCGPCVAQLPKIRHLRDEYADRDFVVLGIHSTADAGKGEKYVERNNLDWPIAFDDSKQTAAAYRVTSWPSLYLIDKEGKIRFARPHPDQLEAAIQLLLAE